MLNWLLKRGVNGSSVSFRRRDAEEPRLRVVKEYSAGIAYGLSCRVQTPTFAVEEIQDVAAELSRRGMPYELRNASGVVTLNLSFGTDIGLAHLAVRLLGAALLSSKFDRDCVAAYHDILHIRNVPRLTGTPE